MRLTDQLKIGDRWTFVTKSLGTFVGDVHFVARDAEYVNIRVDGKGFKIDRADIIAFSPATDDDAKPNAVRHPVGSDLPRGPSMSHGEKAFIFYSWQSDRPNNVNRSFIETCLGAAIDAVHTNSKLAIEPVLDRDTAGLPGAPDIGVSILGKIERAAVVVCDVSLIPPDAGDHRRTPNPNVLIELGYALHALGPERVLLVMNTEFGGPELLPFDLKQKRVITYRLSSGADKAQARKALIEIFTLAVTTILEKFPLEPSTDPILETAIQRTRDARPDQAEALRRFVATVVDEIRAVPYAPDQHATAEIREEQLLKAIDVTAPIVSDFAQVAQAVASMNTEPGLRSIARGLETLLDDYFPKVGGGSAHGARFDLVRFIGHELILTLVAALLREERPLLVRGLLEYEFPLPPSAQKRKTAEDYTVFYQRNEILLKRAERTRRHSEHGQLLWERHQHGGVLSASTSWEELYDADLFLWIASAPPKDHLGHAWLPHTAWYSAPRVPRFFAEATRPRGARVLAQLLAEDSAAGLKNRVSHALKLLAKIHYGVGSFVIEEDLNFDADQIADF